MSDPPASPQGTGLGPRRFLRDMSEEATPASTLLLTAVVMVVTEFWFIPPRFDGLFPDDLLAKHRTREETNENE